jgi:hypothetical protein
MIWPTRVNATGFSTMESFEQKEINFYNFRILQEYKR